MTTYYQIESSPLVRSRFPILAEAPALVADVQVRNKGTLGGSLAHCDPAADLPAVILALEAEIQPGELQRSTHRRCGGFLCAALRLGPSRGRNPYRGVHSGRGPRYRQLLPEVRQ